MLLIRRWAVRIRTKALRITRTVVRVRGVVLARNRTDRPVFGQTPLFGAERFFFESERLCAESERLVLESKAAPFVSEEGP